MARDRTRDEFDDDDLPRRPRRVDVAAARSKVAAPAVLMILFGSISLFFTTVGLVMAAVAPQAIGDAYVNALKPIVESQPPSPARDQQLKQLEVLRTTMRADNPLSIASYALYIVVSGLTILGGVRMKGLRSWGLALTASILSMSFLCLGCACLTFPIGVWSLIVLVNPDVKAAFAANNRVSAVARLGDDNDDDDDDRRDRDRDGRDY